jgi:hypothetical protein
MYTLRKLLEQLLERFGSSLEFYSVWTKPDDYWEQMTSKVKAKKEFDRLVKSGRFDEVHFERWAGQKLEDGTLDGDYMADIEIHKRGLP